MRTSPKVLCAAAFAVVGAIAALSPSTNASAVSTTSFKPASAANGIQMVSEAQFDSIMAARSAHTATAVSPNVTYCFVTADNPHGSSNTANTLFKTRANCSAAYYVSMINTLREGNPNPTLPVAGNTQSASKGANIQTTFYTPRPTDAQITCYSFEYFQGEAKGYLTSGGLTRDAAGTSNVVHAC